MAYSYSQNSPAPQAVSIGPRAEMLPGSPLAELNTPGGTAYAARSKGGAASDLVAILCNSGLPPRIDSIASMRSASHPAILQMVDSGAVTWPQDNVNYFAFAYQRPMAPRMKQTVDEPHAPVGEDIIQHHFIMPLIGALIALGRTGMVHNAIRTTNIFWRIGSATAPQLGECMSAPAGIGQPALFEPIERALSMPLGRGPGTHADDCYSFGVCLALTILGQNPLQGMDDAAITQMKLDRGSFNALVGNRRMQPHHIELLRGLLTDDARQRWTANDLEQWQNGRRATPKSADIGRRAARSLEFGGKEFFQVRPLAAMMASRVGEAAQAVENGVLDKWLRRALGDDDRANNLEDARSSLKETGKTANYEEQLVARTCIALDPSGPIRYRGLSVMPSGLASMLTEASSNGNNIQALSEIISSQMVVLWAEMQKDVKGDILPMAQQYERMRGVLEKTTLGNGIERVVYEVNPGLPCLSPLVRSQYVTNARSLLSALEHTAVNGAKTPEPMDRHIAAFLITRDRRSELLFEAMMTPEFQPKRGLAMLTLYSDMQQKHGPESLPGLAQWLLPRLEPAVQRYLGKAMREKLKTQLAETVKSGNLGAMVRLIDDPERIEHDQQQFRAARMLYLNIMKEIANIEHKLNNRDIVVRNTGKPMAASLSSFLAIVLVVVAVLRVVWQNMMM